MRDPLKEFIDQHRPEMDAAQPSPELWSKIESTMILTPTIPAKPVSWLKYFTFGASAVAVIVVISLVKNTHSHPAVVQTPQTQTELSSSVLPVDEKNKTITVPQENSANEKTATPVPVISEKTVTTVPVPSYFQQEIPVAENISATVQNNPPAAAIPAASKNMSWKMESSSIHIDTVFSGITRLEVTGSSMNVNVHGHAQNELSLKGDLNWKAKGIHAGNQYYSLRFTRKDTVLYVTVSLESEKKNKGVIGYVSSDADLNFDVPENLNLVIRDQFGDASVSGLHGAICDLAISSGNIDVNDMHTNIKVSETFGDFKGRSITGNLNASISSGSATVEKLTGDIVMSTTFGDQKFSQINGNIKTSASSGGVKINGMNGDAKIASTFGDIELVNYKGKPVLTASSGSITGTQVELTGDANFVTTFGDITMNLTNSLDALSFQLTTTFGDIHIDKDGQKYEEESKLILQKGKFLIKASASSGSQSYK